MRVEVLLPLSNLIERGSVPLTWVFQPRQSLIFGRPMDFKHPTRPGTYLSSCYPLTALERSSEGKVTYRAFTVCFYRLRSLTELSVVMDHTTFFQDNPVANEASLRSLVERCEGLGQETGARSLETEVYIQADAQVAFPSTLSFYDNYNEPWLPEALLNLGFRKIGEKHCLASEVPAEQDSSKKETGVRSWRGESIEDLWVRGLHLMEEAHNLIEESIMSMTRFNSLRFWKQEADSGEGSEFASVAEKGYIRKKLIGIGFWSPNIYEVARNERTRLYFLSREDLKERLKNDATGKIFRIIVDMDHQDAYRGLVEGTLCQMKAFGIRYCQVGNIPSSLTGPLNFLNKKGFRVTHRIWKLRKELG